jgi:hypothetical protein
VIEGATHAMSPLACEGFVVCDANHTRIKVKSAQYQTLSELEPFAAVKNKEKQFLFLVRATAMNGMRAHLPEVVFLTRRFFRRAV